MNKVDGGAEQMINCNRLSLIKYLKLLKEKQTLSFRQH